MTYARVTSNRREMSVVVGMEEDGTVMKVIEEKGSLVKESRRNQMVKKKHANM